MKVTMSSRQLELSGRLGPLCLACGNKQQFWVELQQGMHLVQLCDVLEDNVHIRACGRCRSRHSLVMARID